MPHFGQRAGAWDVTSGCMGHTYPAGDGVPPSEAEGDGSGAGLGEEAAPEGARAIRTRGGETGASGLEGSHEDGTRSAPCKAHADRPSASALAANFIGKDMVFALRKGGFEPGTRGHTPRMAAEA